MTHFNRSEVKKKQQKINNDEKGKDVTSVLNISHEISH